MLDGKTNILVYRTGIIIGCSEASTGYSISVLLPISNPRTCEGMYGTSGNLVKLLLLVSIHSAWHQVTILEKKSGGGGGGGVPGPPWTLPWIRHWGMPIPHERNPDSLVVSSTSTYTMILCCKGNH